MRKQRFTFLCSKDERRLITVLANLLQRSQGDAVRFVVINEARKLSAQGQPIDRAAVSDSWMARDEG